MNATTAEVLTTALLSMVALAAAAMTYCLLSQRRSHRARHRRDKTVCRLGSAEFWQAKSRDCEAQWAASHSQPPTATAD